jgi:hypothetical protein
MRYPAINLYHLLTRVPYGPDRLAGRSAGGAHRPAPPSRSSTVACSRAASKRILGLGAISATMRTITIENAGFELAFVQWLVLRHELPDQHVLDHRIIAS